MLCCTLLTGCESEDVFGKTGQYVLKLGEDVFNTGHQGVFGGEEGTDPQSNEETHIFQNYDVKKVEKAPKDEKVAYNFTGPENAGITPSQAPAASTIQPIAPASNVNPTSTIVITAGHCSVSQKSLECPAKQCYKVLIELLLKKTTAYDPGNASKRGKVAISPTSQDALIKDLYKAWKGEGVESGASGAKKAASLLIAMGAIKGKNGNYTSLAYGEKALDYYKKYGKKAELLIKLINKGKDKYSSISNWISSNNMETNRNASVRTKLEGSGVLLKRRCFEGTSSGKYVEYQATYAIAKALQKKLSSKGYNVKMGRTSRDTTKMEDGSYFSNRNIAEYGNKQKAIIHFVIHWDSATDEKENGMLLEIGNKLPQNKVNLEIGKRVAKAMEAYAKKPLVHIPFRKVKPVDELTTLNWATVPTVIVECGWFDKEYDREYKGDAKKWVDDHWKVFKAGIEAGKKGN